MAATAVLDTTILSHLARNETAVTAAFSAWLEAGNGIVISRVTAYEFQRGVYAGSVSAQEQQAGELFLVNFAIIEVDANTWDTAAEIWGALARTGKTRRMDADILIAATALRGGYEVATRNRKDFDRIVTVRPRLVVHIW
jgi:predicted nucleic acid-binding protein